MMNVNLDNINTLINMINVKIKLYYITRKLKSMFASTKRGVYEEFRTDLDPDEAYKILIELGYQWNYISYHEKGEVLNVRKLYKDRQIHLRIFNDGVVTIHDELNYDFYPLEHLKGVSLYRADIHIVKYLKDKLKGY